MFKLFGWVPDGIYDQLENLVRYQVANGMPVYVIKKSWVDNGVPDDVPLELRQPWGAFPDMPPRPPKPEKK